MIVGKFRHKGLRRLYEDDDASGVPAHSIRKIKAILAALEFADNLSQVATMPGWKLHPLKGERKGEYGITADWQIGIEIPYLWKRAGGADADGIGDIVLDTKYQFWKRDLPGAQYKAAAFVRIKLPTGDDGSDPRLGSGSTDFIAGLAAGYESRRWYWFASGAYRANTEGGGGLEKGDGQFLNAVGGIRPVLTAYDEPDTVLMVELNWERAGRDGWSSGSRSCSRCPTSIWSLRCPMSSIG